MESYSLSDSQKQQVILHTRECIGRANRLLKLDLAHIAVDFDLKGRASGMFEVRAGCSRIRYNEIIFSRYYEDALLNTVAHEVAHYVVHSIWGLGNVKPHGDEWQQVMRALGAKPEVTSRYDVSGLPLRQQRRFSYACACMTHQLSATRHNKVQRKQARYCCRKCQQPLSLQSPTNNMRE